MKSALPGGSQAGRFKANLTFASVVGLARVASNLDVLELRCQRFGNFDRKSPVNGGCDVVFNVLKAESNRSSAVANSTNWNLLRLDKLIHQAT